MIQVSRRVGLLGLFASGITAIGAPAARASGLGGAELWKTMRLVRADGGSFTLGELPGPLVLAYVWGSYCQACIDQLPQLRRLPEVVGRGRLDVVLISPADQWESDYAMAARYGMAVQAATIDGSEPDERVAAAFGMQADEMLDVPQSFVFSRPDLRLVRSELGSADWSDPDMVELLRRAARA